MNLSDYQKLFLTTIFEGVLMKSIRIAVLIVSLVLVSCATGPSPKEVHDSWLGAHKSKLIQAWGPPTRYGSDGKGGEILTYERTNTTGTVLYGVYYQNTHIYFSDMYANQSGIIYFYRFGER